MRIVKEIVELGNLTDEPSKCLTSVLVALGFSDYVHILDVPVKSKGNNDVPELSFKFIKLLKSKTRAPLYEFMHIQEAPMNWQLRLFGEYMDRSMDGQFDSRVSFKPDAWQREVLDCIDQDASLLVVGKSPYSSAIVFLLLS
jgi:hypothetical protein